MRRRLYLLALALLASLLTSCESPTSHPVAYTPTSTSTATSTPTGAIVSSPLIGTYTTTITQKDINAVDLTRNALTGSDVQPGSWLLTFRNDGYYTAFGGNYPLGISYIGAGPYIVAQNKLTLVDGKCEEFYSEGRIGVYSWSLKGKWLLLKMIADTCTARVLVMTSHPWQRQS